MAEELVEGSIYSQIKAIEGWALTVYQESVKKSPNVDVILDTLRKINLQARKIEWRGKGLDDLPKGQVGEDLKKKVTQLRAAVVTLRDIKKDKELSNASKRTLRMLSSLATEAIKLVEQFAKGLPDLGKMKVDQIEDFLRGEGDYAAYALDVRRKLWNDFSKLMIGKNIRYGIHYNLSGIDLRGFDFSYKTFLRCTFSQTNFSECSFLNSSFQDCKFIDSNLEGANFITGIFHNEVAFTSVKASKANFKQSELFNRVVFSGNFDEADFSNLAKNGGGMIFDNRLSFRNSNFKGADMIWIVGSPISLQNADLRSAKVKLDTSSIKNLKGSNFVGANVARSRWTILGGDLNDEVALRNVLRQAKHLEDAIFSYEKF